MISPLQTAILKTLAYASVFEFPLTFDELYKYLITPKKYSRDEVKRALPKLPGVVKSDEYIVLRECEQVVEKRKQSAQHLNEKMESALFAKKLFGWLPTIDGIFVTGGTAVGNVRNEDDVDFLIVTKPGWLWTTRVCVAAMSRVLGKYRNRNADVVKNMWCFNMWLDSTNLQVQKNAQNLYSAHEVAQAVPIVDKNGIHQRFLRENRWALSFLAHAFDVGKRQQRASKSLPTAIHTNPIEHFFFSVQTRYMRSVQTTEKVSEHFAFFHPRATSNIVLQSYKSMLKNIGVKG